MTIKKYLPKSLFGRSLLIIILPVAMMQMLVAYIFFNAHWDRVTANLSASVAADVSVAVELYKQSPSLERADRLNAMFQPQMELSIALNENDSLPTASRNAFFSVLDQTLRKALQDSLTDPFWFDTTRYPNYVDIRVEVDEGVLRFIAARERVFAPTGFVFIFWLFTATTLLTLVSVIFIRNQARPIARLAAAAEAFGKGQDISGYKPSGASEVRLAGQAFLKMRQRITRHIEQRANFLAGVSHDLRTPLTRLNLHFAMQEDTPDNLAARKDLKDMQAIIETYLDFARDMSTEQSEPTDIQDLVLDIIPIFQDPQPVLTTNNTLELEVRPVSLKRALANVLDNSAKYASVIHISIQIQSQYVEILIEDDGPSIPEEDRETAIKAFQRLDESRNQNIKGTGLGLSITRDLILSHGGRLSLNDSENLGGLSVSITLPR